MISRLKTLIVQRTLNNTSKRPARDDVAFLCNYLNYDVGDLLKMEDVSEVAA